MNSKPTPDASPVSVACRAYWMPKRGMREEECEDAFACSEEGARHATGAPFRAAVADGATEAAFSRRWARLLAEQFVAHGSSALADRLADARQRWAASVAPQAGTRPWYAAAKAEAGAFAALLGVTLCPGTGQGAGTWRGASVGDCNLFHLRDGRLVHAWPFERPEDFGNRPTLVPSRPGQTPGAPDVDCASGQFHRGDAFVLATDAAAAWLLRTRPADALAWKDPAAFAEAANAARTDGPLKNDDTTVVVVRVT